MNYKNADFHWIRINGDDARPCVAEYNAWCHLWMTPRVLGGVVAEKNVVVLSPPLRPPDE